MIGLSVCAFYSTVFILCISSSLSFPELGGKQTMAAPLRAMW